MRAAAPLLAILPALACTPAAPPPPHACAVEAVRGDAADNRPGDPLRREGYDVVRVPGAEAAPPVCVVYSHRRVDDGSAGCGPSPQGSPENNVAIFLVPLADEGGRRQALVFGAGYGDWCLASHGAACDARWTTAALRDELGMAPGASELRFVAPHGHLDHVNPEYLAALEAQGYPVREIVWRRADEGIAVPAGTSVERMAWSEAQRARVRVVDAAEELGPLASPLGTVRFAGRPGHTPGALDLVLEASAGSVVLRGSRHEGHEAGRLVDLKAHGNALLTTPEGG